MSRAQQKQGAHGEELAEHVLSSLGVRMIEKIATPVRLVKNPRGDGSFFVRYEAAVSGDRRAIMGDGRSVLVEVKTIMDRNLSWSDLREHQPAALSYHTENGGLTLLVWVHQPGIFVLEWPIDDEDFRPGHTLTPERASVHDEHTRDLLRDYVYCLRREGA
jgi:hypothetical protein